jgi:hypothetical protein
MNKLNFVCDFIISVSFIIQYYQNDQAVNANIYQLT